MKKKKRREGEIREKKGGQRIEWGKGGEKKLEADNLYMYFKKLKDPYTKRRICTGVKESCCF